MMRSLALLLTLIVSVSANANSLGAFMRNREGMAKFGEKNYYRAYQAFLKALEEDPLNPNLHLNLARIFEANEEWEKAEKGYRSALRIIPENSQLHFETMFNLALVLAKQKKIDEALAAYQACLEIVPDSKEVKTNIELLWQQGGGGEGDDNKDQKDQQGKDQQKKDGDGKDQNKDKPQDKGQQQQKKQPKPFESKELNNQDVKKILDEIKNQEQSIRAQEYERNAKEAPRGKDW